MSAPATSYQEALLAAALADPRVVVMTAENRAAIRQLPERLGGRFIDVGICEQTMVGAAAGLALRGRIPVVHALATFLTMRAFEFIRTDVGIGRLPVKLVGAVPGFLSDANGPTHQAIEDVSLMRGIPGMEVVCPTDEEELVAALPSVLASPQPCYLRYVGGPARVRHHAPYRLGAAEVLSEGHDVALLSYGLLVGEAVRAAELLSERGVRARVLNLRSLVPLDEEAVLRAARETGLLVTVEDHFLIGGLHSILAELMLRHRLAPRVLPLALERRWFRPALLPDVLEAEGFAPAKIADQIVAALRATSRGPHA